MADENDEVDLEELVGKVLDARGITKERFDALDGIGELKALITAGAPAPAPAPTPGAPAPSFDETAFMTKVGELIDGKMKGLTSVKTPPLKRWLGLA